MKPGHEEIMAIRCVMAFVVLSGSAALAADAPPTVEEIATAMQDVINLDETDGSHVEWNERFLEIDNVEILKGGATARPGEYLYIGNARQTWKVSRSELLDIIREETKSEAAAAGLFGNMAKKLVITAVEKSENFKKGDEFSGMRFRVRLERAGDDWIAIDSKVIKIPPADSKVVD